MSTLGAPRSSAPPASTKPPRQGMQVSREAEVDDFAEDAPLLAPPPRLSNQDEEAAAEAKARAAAASTATATATATAEARGHSRPAAASSASLTVHAATWSVFILHSRLYLAATLLQLVLVASMIVWVALDHNAVHRGFFLLLELLLTSCVLFDTVLQIHFQGPRKYFCNRDARREGGVEDDHQGGRRQGEQYKAASAEEDAEAEEGADVAVVVTEAEASASLRGSRSGVGEPDVAVKPVVDWRGAGHLALNYAQLLLTGLCVGGFVTTLLAGSINWAEDVTLTLLFIRGVALLFFFALNHVRSADLQGRGLLRGACCLEQDDVDDEWDVKF